jgi:hypothetical protein
MKRGVVLAAGSALLCGVGAGAALGLAPHPKGSSPLEYTSETTSLAPGQQGTVQPVSCDFPGVKLAGGGVGWAGTNSSSLEVATSAPGDDSDDDNGKPDDIWVGYGNNETAGNAPLVVHVICAEGLKLGYEMRKAKVGNNDVTTRKVRCEDGTRAAGGGVYISGSELGVEVPSLGPFDGSDADNKPDDGYVSSAASDNSGRERATFYAICAKQVQLAYKRHTEKLPPNVVSSAPTASCPKDAQVIGGGVRISKPSLNTVVSATQPGDAVQDVDSIPDDYWIGYAFNLGTGERKVTVDAICLKI